MGKQPWPFLSRPTIPDQCQSQAYQDQGFENAHRCTDSTIVASAMVLARLHAVW